MKSPLFNASIPGNRKFLPWLFALLFALSVQPVGFAQSAATIDWATLSQVKFEKKFSEELGISYEKATFGQWLLPLHGKAVAITGYVIPLDGLGATYVLSRNPNASCFFCGGAGPETVIELRLKPSAIRRYKLDEIRTFKGILQMNASNLDQMTYVLLEAEPI
jgi:hypothetical protein